MDASPHTTWLDDGDEEAAGDGPCRAFCTCGWYTPAAQESRTAAQRLGDLHKRNARRRALTVPLGDLDDDVVTRVLTRMAELLVIGVDADAAIARAREDEVDGRLGGQLVMASPADDPPLRDPTRLDRMPPAP